MSAASLTGRTVLVTGASRGIGRAVAVACAEAGATVLAAARNVRALEALADELVAAGRPEPILVPINLQTATVDDYAHVAELVAARCACLHGLVLGAGMLGDLTPLAQYDPVTWARVFQVNLHSALLLTQACWPLLRAAAPGAVVFTLAEQAYVAKANWGAYAVSKSALRTLFETWAAESGARAQVRVNAVVPHGVHTRLHMDAYPAATVEQLVPAALVAGAYVTLLGDAAHGQVVHVPAD